VEPGNRVEKGQILFDVETDKAVIEVEADHRAVWPGSWPKWTPSWRSRCRWPIWPKTTRTWTPIWRNTAMGPLRQPQRRSRQ
jgi:hypothetical protein